MSKNEKLLELNTRLQILLFKADFDNESDREEAVNLIKNLNQIAVFNETDELIDLIEIE